MSWPCHNYTDTNDREQVPCSSSSLILSTCTVGEPAMVPGGEVGCFPKHPLHFPEDHHLQCNSYTAFTSLPMVLDWFSLLAPIILLLYKVQHKAFVSFFGSYIFSRLPARPMQKQTKEMTHENRIFPDFYGSNKLQKEQGEKQNQLLLYNYRPVRQLIATALPVLWLG